MNGEETTTTTSAGKQDTNPTPLQTQQTKPQNGRKEIKRENSKKSKKDQVDSEVKFDQAGGRGKRFPRRKRETDDATNLGIFVFKDISGNKKAAALINDLIKCFTCNLQLSHKELDNLNANLYERTVSVLLNVLNSCIEKIVKTLINNGHIQKVFYNNSALKKEASCQTDISGDITSSNVLKSDNC